MLPTIVLDSIVGKSWMTPLREWLNPSAFSLRDRLVIVRIATILATGSSMVAGTRNLTGAHWFPAAAASGSRKLTGISRRSSSRDAPWERW